MTTADSILDDLERQEWVCGSHWYATHRPTFAQRISLDLKARRGLDIESRRCTTHRHRGSLHEYRLVRRPVQLALIA